MQISIVGAKMAKEIIILGKPEISKLQEPEHQLSYGTQVKFVIILTEWNSFALQSF